MTQSAGSPLRRAPSPHEPIALVGIGCRFAEAPDLQAFWDITRAGRDTFAPVPQDRWDHAAFFDKNPRARDKSYAPTGSWIDDIRSFPAIAFQLPPRRVEVMDPQQRLAFELALAAIEDAGLTPDELPRMTGVYMGVTAVEYRTLASSRLLAQMMASGNLGRAPGDATALAESVENVLSTRPYSASGVLSNMIAATITQELGLRGPAFTTDAACASSLIAIDSAIKALRDGSVDAALAGGVYLCITPEHHVAFSRIGAISKQGLCLPFDERADGFVQGDGAGVLLLKRLSDAERDHDRVYAVIHGIGVNNDGGENGPMAPVKEGQIDVIERAWADAGIAPDALGYVEAHGTGTLVGDHIEFEGLSAALAEKMNAAHARAALGSSKANFGHTMSAAGVTGVMRAALAIHHGEIPPMANFASPKPDLPLADSPFYIPTAATPWTAPARVATVSSFGFGGTNVHAVLGNLASVPSPLRAPVTQAVTQAAPLPTAPAAAPELILLSAHNLESLREVATRLARTLQADPQATLAGTARALAHRKPQATRFATVATDLPALIRTLTAFGAGEHPEGVRLGDVAPGYTPKIAFLYPGQGAQRVGMLAGLLARYPVARRAMDAMDAATRDLLPHPVSHYLYPDRRGEQDAAQALAALTATEHTQPALFAVGYALTELLRAIGLTPTVTAGHSVGEFTAAMAAGLLSPEDGVRWCARRGLGMAALAGDPGTMAAWLCDAATARPLLAPNTVIANVNHPRQVVVSGDTPSMAIANAQARAAGIDVTELRVSHGFHSPVFETLHLDQEVNAIHFQESSIPVASCIASSAYSDPATAHAVFTRHARSPVLWTDALTRCAEAGADVYLQVGAGGPLLSFVRGTFPQAPAVALAGKDDHDQGRSLLDGLGHLYTLGAALDPRPLISDAPLASLPPTVYPRERYWVVADRPVDTLKLASPSGTVTTPRAARSHAEAPTAVKAPSPTPAPSAPTSDPLADLVYAAIAKASAYPRDALRPTMKLGDDLGFDSMMVADLAEELRKQIPGFSGIPQELLINAPTIADILAFVRSPEATQAAAQHDDDTPLQAYAPSWTLHPLPSFGERTTKTYKTYFAEHSAPFANHIFQPVASLEAADLLLFTAPDALPSLAAVLAGEHPVPDPAAPLLALAEARASSEKPCDLLILAPDAAPWTEGLAGAARAIARDWPDQVVKLLRSDRPLDPATLHAELTSFDTSVDVLYRDGRRHVAALTPLTSLPTTPLAADDVVVITGGTRGIGRQLALRLADHVAQVILLGRTALTPEHPHIQAAVADVTDPAAVARALSGLHPTVLIHAAGLLADGPLGHVAPELAQRARAVKAAGLIHAVRAAGPTLRRVLALGSWAGRFGNAHQAHYAAGNALMAALVAALPSRITGVTAEFGPWTDSDMARSIPASVAKTMRDSGVRFVGTSAGLAALEADLTAPSGTRVHGIDLPQVRARGHRTLTLSLASHPYLRDHAVPTPDGAVPVLPLAAATTLLAETANLETPFEIKDLRLFQGVAVRDAVPLTVTFADGQAELRQGEKHTLSYRAALAPIDPTTLPPLPAPTTGGDPAPLPLRDFYSGLTFHGPLLQGITHIDALGPDFIRGRVKTSRPTDWIRAQDTAGQTAWAVDPLAFDAAMQLAAYVAWLRYRRAGTPVSLGRWVQLAPWPAAGDLLVEARFTPGDQERLSADLTFRAATGEVIAFANDVVADMKKVESETAENSKDKTNEYESFVVKPEWVDPAQWRGYKDLAMRLYAVEAMGLHQPYFDLHEGTARNTTQIDGHEVLNYSSYNYIGLSGDPRVIAEVTAAIHQYGTSVSASRVASGERPFHRDLERELAQAHGAEDSLVMAGGHATNVNTIGHLFGPKDLIVHDELIHDSCLQGIKLSGAARRSFKHEDVADAEHQLRELRRHYEKVMIIVEGAYSMDGDLTNLPEFVRLKKTYGTLLMVDEAHSFGTVGRRGCGVGEYFGMDDPDSPERARYGLVRSDVDIWMGTMSKSLASMGGWVAGKKELMTYLRYTSPGFVFAAGIPPALGQAALSSLRYMLAEPERVAQLQHNCLRFYTLLTERGIDTGPATGLSPVIPVITGDSMWALKLSERLLHPTDGRLPINAKPIIFPAVSNDSARLRFFMTNMHTEEQLVYTADTIAEVLAAIRAESPKK